jgi:signal transduction histidine kinase/ligand-binding sensor domain-containing protein/DNA-binding response OmpR family regulator
MRVYDERDGLPQNTATAIAFDHRGYLWVGTEDGIARYNGRAWTTVPMPDRMGSNFIRAISVAHDGGLWLATFGGGVAELRDGRWTCYDTSSGLPHDIVLTVLATADASGRTVVWAGTRDGLARIRDGVCSRVDGPEGQIWSVLESSAASGGPALWLGTSKGVYQQLANGWKLWTVDDGIPGRGIWAVAELETGAEIGARRLFVGTKGSGIGVLDGERWSTWEPSAAIRAQETVTLVETSCLGAERALWVGTLGGGLWRHVDGRWTVFDADNGLPNNDVWSVVERREPNGANIVWVGTGAGLVRMRFDQWISFDTSSGLPDQSVMSLAETTSDGEPTVWIGTDAGLARHEKGGWSVVDETSGLPNARVDALLGTRDARGAPVLWAGTRRGVARFDRDGVTCFDISDGLPDNSLFSLAEPAAEGHVYAGTNNGLGVFDGTTWSKHPAVAQLRDRACTGLVCDGATLWFGTIGSGVVRCRGESVEVFGTERGLPNAIVTTVLPTTDAAGRAAVWVGTTMGAARIYPDDPARPPLVLTEDSTPALPNKNVYRIVHDRAGRVYMTTNRGVARLTPRRPTPGDPAEYTVETFTAEDGLPSNECNTGASMVDGRGRVWVGTIRGAAVLDPEWEAARPAPSPIYVESAFVNGGRPFERAAVLSHAENALTFEYALLSYFRESEVRYSTRLVGFDRGPSAWTREPRRSYTNLPAGRYRFVVRARDHAGTESEADPFDFEIRPAPWRTWWAYLAYAGAGAGALAAGYRARTTALRHRSEELEQVVRERTAALSESEAKTREQAESLARAVEQLRASAARARATQREAHEANRAKSAFLSNMSHELRTPLNAVLGFAQLMERDGDRSPDDLEALAAIERSGEHLLALINDVLSISKIEAGRLSLAESPFDLRRLLDSVEEMLRLRAEAKGIALVFDVADPVPRSVRGDEPKLRQVLVNLLGNAIKFTDAGGVVLRARWADGVCDFEVEDTGHGIAPEEMDHLFVAFAQTESGREAKEGTGLGLAISQNIVRLMGGEIRVTSELGKGTRFAFDVALPATEATAESDGPRRVSHLAPGQPAHRLLVVDDRPENRLLLVRLLGRVGFQTRSAENGAEAIEIWRSWRPHLVWMDMRMPVMDGREATGRIRRLERDLGVAEPTRVVALTASAFEQDREEILAAGCDDFVAKPYREATIFEKLAEHLSVAFVYEDDGAASSDEAPSDLTAQRFAALPAEVLERFREALVSGDMVEASAVVDAMAAHDDALARAVRSMLRQYRTDELLELSTDHTE